MKPLAGKYRAALIGCGRISPFHIDAFAKNNDRTELVAVCDPIIERAIEQATGYQKQIPGTAVRYYTDYQKMLFEIQPDITSIATESGKHPEITINCLNAGAHVICEKPMALSTFDADRMIATAKKAGKKLAVCFQNRFNIPVQRLHTAIEAGRFGRILHGMIQTRWKRSPAYYAEAPWRGTWAQDGGTLMNQCIHGIDLLQWLMGDEPVRIQSQTRRYIRPIEAEDFGSAIVEFKNGIVGIIEGSACVFPDDLSETLSVFGEKGTAVIGGMAVNKLETWRLADDDIIGDAASVENNSAENPSTVYGFGHTPLFRDFFIAIEQERQPYISGEEGRKAVELVLAIYQSQKTGKAVELPCNFSTQEMEGYFDK